MVSKFYTNKTDTMLAVEKNGCALEYASDALRADREVVMAAVSYYGWALEYASEELRKDRDIVMAAAEKDACALMFASLALRADPEVVMAAVSKHGEALQYASEALRADREVVMAAVQSKPGYLVVLKYASAELRNDREVVLAAVKNQGKALSWASEALRADKSVVLEAMKQDISNNCFAELSPKDMLWVLDLLPAKTAIKNQEEAGSKILGCVGMFVDQMRKDCGLLKKDYESKDISFEDYYENIVSYISVRDIGLLCQLSTNRYVEDESEVGEVIKRSPRRENEYKNDDGMTFASITKEDRAKGLKRFIKVSDYPDVLRGLNYGR